MKIKKENVVQKPTKAKQHFLSKIICNIFYVTHITMLRIEKQVLYINFR